MEKETHTIRIEVEYEGERTNTGKLPFFKICHVNRMAYLDDELAYSDRMTERVYFKSNRPDPIRNLVKFLSGLEQSESRKNCAGNSRKFVGLVQKIRRKLFGQGFDFKT